MFSKKHFWLLTTAIFASLFLATSIASSVNAAASADNFHASNLELWGGGSAANRPISGTTTQICRSNDCLYSLKFDWSYNSIDPIETGDSFQVPFIRAEWAPNSYYLSVQSNTQWKTVSDAGGNELFKWRTTTGRWIQFEFLEGAAGKTSLSGSLETARSIKSGSSLIDDATQFEITIGDSEPVYAWMSPYVRNTLNTSSAGGQLWFSSSSDNYVEWRLYGNTAPSDYLFRTYADGTAATAVLPKTAEIHDYTIELAFRETDATFGAPNFYFAIPMVTNDGKHPSSQVSSIRVNDLYKEVKQNQGESYEDFKNRLSVTEYGFYKYSDTGRTTFIVKFGDFPGNVLTKDSLFDYSSYNSFEEWLNTYTTEAYKTLLQEAVDRYEADSFWDGSHFFPYVTLRETATDSSLSALASTATFSYTDGDGQAHSTPATTERPLYQTPDAIASEMGGLQIVLSDKTNHGKINDTASFVLERQNGSSWESYGELQKNSKGYYAIAGLTPGDTYRILETSYPAHYQSGSLKLYSDAGYSTETANTFTAPSDSGTVLYATNAKETFTVTFNPGDGQLADQYRSKTVEYGASATAINPQQYITPPIGKVFDHWEPQLAESITADTTYNAIYKNKTTNVRARIIWNDANNADNVRPSSVNVTLLQTIDGQTRPYDVIKTASASNNYIVEWAGMNTHYNGEPIIYDAQVQYDGYTYTSALTDDGYITITGTYSPKVIITVDKTWNDDNDALHARPSDDQVVFNILADGQPTGESFTLAEGESIKLDAYSSLSNPVKKYNYTIEEVPVHGYETSEPQKISEEFGYITFAITNKKLNPSPASVGLPSIPISQTNDALEDGEEITATITPRNDSYPTIAIDNPVITNDTNNITFQPVQITEPGIYEYDIDITGDEYADVGVDVPQITARINAVYDLDSDSIRTETTYLVDGELIDPSSIDINIHHVDPDPIVENVNIQLPTDEPIDDGAITATVTAKDGSPMPTNSDGTVKNFVNPDGTINVGDIEYTEPGEYEYDIKLDSDNYDIDLNEFTVKTIVELDESTNTLSVAGIKAYDADGNEIDLSALKLGISRKATNPDTGISLKPILIASFAVSTFGALLFTVRKRR